MVNQTGQGIHPVIQVAHAPGVGRDACGVWPVVAGCCFPEGMVHAGRLLAVETPAKEVVAAECLPLQSWPDGSVRWGTMQFTTHEAGPHRVITDSSVSRELALDGPVMLTLDREPGDQQPAIGTCDRPSDAADQAVLSNGLVGIELQAGAGGPIRSLRALEHTWLSAGDAAFRVDQASNQYQSAERPGWVQVIHRSPLRTRVRVHGHLATESGQPWMDYRFDVEVWAGLPSVRMDLMLINRLEGAESRTVHAIESRWSLGDATSSSCLKQLHHGVFAQPRLVRTDRPVTIRCDADQNMPHVTEPGMFNDDQTLPRYLKPGQTRTQDWVGIQRSEGTAYLQLNDMAAMHPKQIDVDAGQVVVGLWPTEAGPLVLPQGRARRHTLLWTFDHPRAAQQVLDETHHKGVRARLDALNYEGRALVDPRWVRQRGACEVDRTLSPGSNLRVERWLNEWADLPFATGHTDLGDAPDPGYNHVYHSAGQRPLRPQRDIRVDRNGFGAEFAGDSRYEPIWTNNEYDVIHLLTQELLRTGNDRLWPKLTHATRHNIEVDFVWFSEDPWQHHGSPAHSAYHNFASAYPSHIWTQGLLTYHRLTGDPDVIEVVRALSDTIIRNLEDPQRGPLLRGFNREIGWATLALAHTADFTREPRYINPLNEIIEYLMAYDRHGAHTVVKLSNSDPRDDLHRQMVTSFFGYASMVEAVDFFAREFNRPDARQWLIGLIHDLATAIESCLREGCQLHFTWMITHALAIGHELTQQNHLLELGMVLLEQWLDRGILDRPSFISLEPAIHDRTLAPKPAAMCHRAMNRFARRAHDAGLLDRVEYQSVPAQWRDSPKTT